MGYVEVAVIDFFSRLCCNINPASTIIAETIRALSFCKRMRTGRFIGCALLLQIWLLSHLCVRKERVKQNFFLKISPLSMALEEECHQDKTEKHWVQELRNVKEEEIMWRAPWVFPQSIVYRCGDYTCVPLPRL